MIAVVGVAFVVVLVALGVVGGLGWFGDLAVLGHPVGVALGAPATIALFVSGHDAAAAIALALLVTSSAAIVLPRTPSPSIDPASTIRLAAVNLLFESDRPRVAAKSALTADADILVVSELIDESDEVLARAYPHRVTSEHFGDSRFVQGVFSRLPIERLELPGRIAGQVLRVRVGGSIPFVLYAGHLPRPALRRTGTSGVTSFRGHRHAVRMLRRYVDAESEPVVVAGDLNLSDRASGYRALTRGRRDALRGQWCARTFDGGSWIWPPLSLRIDHIFVPGRWGSLRGSTFRLDGSDHRGVVADIGPI